MIKEHIFYAWYNYKRDKLSLFRAHPRFLQMDFPDKITDKDFENNHNGKIVKVKVSIIEEETDFSNWENWEKF